MTGTCLKSQDSSLQVGVHGCQALISDRNVFKESGFIVASWVHGCQALIRIGTCLKSQDSSLQVGFIVASWVHGCQALISDRNVFKLVLPALQALP